MSSRISRYQMLMGMAEVVSRRGTCSRSQVGVIVAIASRPLVSGYNGTPAGMPHCDHTCICNGLGIPPRVVPIDGHDTLCRANTPCSVSVHAEANAIAYAARHGLMLAEALLFTTMAPCYSCSQLIINAGIVEVVYSRTYRDDSGLILLGEAGVRVCQQEA